MYRISGIVWNLRNFAKKSGKCQKNWLFFSNVRKMLGTFYMFKWRYSMFYVFLFNVKKKKRLESKLKAQNIFYTLIICFIYIISFVHCWCNTKLWQVLKLVSANFYQIVTFHQMIVLKKIWKMFFISSKKLFLFLKYSNFCISVFPSISPCQPLL